MGGDPIDDCDGQSPLTTVWPDWNGVAMFSTPVRKKRVVGVAALAVILVLFFTFNRFPKLDVVGEDLDAVTAPPGSVLPGFLHRA